MSHATIRLDIGQTECDSDDSIHAFAKAIIVPTLGESQHWIHAAVLLLALMSLVHCGYTIFISCYEYCEFRARYTVSEQVDTVDGALELMERKNRIYEGELQRRTRMTPDNERYINASFVLPKGISLSIEERERREKVRKLRPERWVNWWNVVTLVAATFQVSGSFVFLLDPAQRVSRASACIGFGCFFAWANVLRYLQYDMSFFFMFSAIFRSFSTVARYMIGALVVFFGYALLGSTVFWQSPRFQSMSSAISIQYALLVGDSIYDTFADLTRIDLVFGQVYLYTFVILFICVVQNLLTSIIQRVYSDDRKAELRTLLEKERTELQEAQKQAEQELAGKRIIEEAPAEEDKTPDAELRSQIRDATALLDRIKAAYHTRRADLKKKDANARKEWESAYEGAVRSLNGKIAEMSALGP